MRLSDYGRVLGHLMNAHDELRLETEQDFPREAELVAYFIRMSIDAAQDVVNCKLGDRRTGWSGDDEDLAAAGLRMSGAGHEKPVDAEDVAPLAAGYAGPPGEARVEALGQMATPVRRPASATFEI